MWSDPLRSTHGKPEFAKHPDAERGTTLVCHLSAGILADYGQRLLEPEQLLALDDHLALCSECRRSLRRMRVKGPALAALKALINSLIDAC